MATKGSEVRRDVTEFLREHVFGHKNFLIVMGVSEAPRGPKRRGEV